MSGGAGAPAGGAGGVRPALARFAELVALTTVAVGQPLFDLLGKSPAFFVAHRAEPLDLVLFALLPTVGLAAALLAVEAVAGRLRRGFVMLSHASFLALLGAALGLLVAQRLPALPVAAAIVVAIGFAAAIVWLSRTRAGATFLAAAGALAVLLPLHFLLLTPVRRLLLPAAGAADDGIAVRKPLPVVMLVFDELPLSSLLDSQGRVAARRFPNFAAVAARSTWYRRATSVSAVTQLAVPALLTGRYPPPDSLPVFTDHPRNLFTLLASSHHVRAIESLTRLCPPAVCGGDAAPAPPLSERLRSLFGDTRVVYLHLVLPAAWTAGLPSVDATWAGFARDAPGSPADRMDAIADPDGRRRDVPRQAAAFLADLQRGAREQRPGLYYLHLELPHIPWRYLPGGLEYGPISGTFFPDGIDAEHRWVDDEWLLAQGAQRHLLQLAYADRILGEVLAALAANGLAQRSLLVVTADHGTSFVAGEPIRDVTPGNYPEALGIPLFVSMPGQRTASVSELPARIVDVLPTVLHALEVEALPWRLDGSSLLRPAELAGRDEVIVVDGERRSLPLAPVEAAQRGAVARLSRWFGDDRPAAELLRLERRPELAGQAVGELAVASQPGAGVAFEQPWFFDRVDRRSGFVPARVVGRLVPLPGGAGVSDNTDVAVAVNGVVRSTTRSFRWGKVVRFGALVPADALVDGRNVVEVFLVPPGAGQPLVPTFDQSGPRYRLRREAGEVDRIEATNGTACSLDPRAVPGGLVHEEWYVAGWAKPAGDWPFAVVMVFVGDDLAHVVPTSIEPPAGSRAAGKPGYERAGFRFTIPASLLRAADGSRGASVAPLRVFAVAGERCSELRFED